MTQHNVVRDRVFIGLGTNLGSRRVNLERALEWLRSHATIDLIRHTAAMETQPWGVLNQPVFLNMVAEIRTSLPPDALLKELKGAERALGRRTDQERWGPRVIDLDILLFGERIIESTALTIPHPHLTERPFVVAQIAQLAPDIVHPTQKKKIADLATS